jgi:hypothetical protein
MWIWSKEELSSNNWLCYLNYSRYFMFTRNIQFGCISILYWKKRIFQHYRMNNKGLLGSRSLCEVSYSRTLMRPVVRSPEPIHTFWWIENVRSGCTLTDLFWLNGITLWNCNCNASITIYLIHRVWLLERKKSWSRLLQSVLLKKLAKFQF